MAKEFKQVKTIEELRKILDNGTSEFFVQLWGGARSWKTLTYADKLDKNGNNKIQVFNDYDATLQVLTEKNLFNRKYTNIGFAMERGGFYYAWT